MMELSQLQTLLWDVDLERVDLEQHAGFLIRRVLERGSWGEWLRVRAYYGDARIEREVEGMRHLDPKALSYIAAILQRPPESFRCYTTKPSLPAPWLSSKD